MLTPEPRFRIIPPDDKGYSGLTALPIGDGRELVVAATGAAAEAVLLERLEAMRDG